MHGAQIYINLKIYSQVLVSFGESKDINKDRNAPRMSLPVSEYTLLLEVSKQDLEETLRSAESSAPCSFALCRCVNPAQGPDSSQVQGTSLTASFPCHQRTLAEGPLPRVQNICLWMWVFRVWPFS